MKFVIATQELNVLLARCLNVVGQKAAIPILANILVEAKDNELVITATDLTVGIRCHTKVKVLHDGATAIPAKKFSQLLRELTIPHIELSANSNEVTEISAGSSRFKLNGMAKREFPSLPTMEDATRFQIKESDLKQMLFRTAFAVSREDSRYVLTGVCMQIANSRATFTGTDGKRLAVAHVPLQIDHTFVGSYIIPLKAIEELLKSLSDDDTMAQVLLLPDKIAFEMQNTVVITKLLSGDYPDVKRVIPEQVEKRVALHREELMSLLRQVSLFTDENHISVRFTFTDGELRLTANTMEIGEGKVSMPANYQGEKLEIAFNPVFFIDILRHCKQDVVTMGVTDPYNPGVIIDCEGSEKLLSDESPLYILMPMRLNEQ